MKTITLQFAIEAAEKAVADKPEGYVYINPQGMTAFSTEGGNSGISCDYFYEYSPKRPSCLVGQVLAAAGLTGDDITESHKGSDAQTLFRNLRDYGNLEVTEEAEEFLQGVQWRQDGGIPWSEAVVTVKQMLKTRCESV